MARAIVVGGGLAGVSAANTVLECGGKVTPRSIPRCLHCYYDYLNQLSLLLLLYTIPLPFITIFVAITIILPEHFEEIAGSRLLSFLGGAGG